MSAPYRAFLIDGEGGRYIELRAPLQGRYLECLESSWAPGARYPGTGFGRYEIIGQRPGRRKDDVVYLCRRVPFPSIATAEEAVAGARAG